MAEKGKEKRKNPLVRVLLEGIDYRDEKIRNLTAENEKLRKNRNPAEKPEEEEEEETTEETEEKPEYEL